MLSKTSLTILILLDRLLSNVFLQAPGENFYNVKKYGAKGDGKILDSKAINKAIEQAALNGGGTVYLPAGMYLSGSIRLKSNISLFIDQGAMIIAALFNSEDQYDEEETGSWQYLPGLGA